ncbi:hypothetical protein Daura_24080 [Dactylosporangium aurantiacum]|uniref:NACHT domain-containing protein n=1 Tax=Dactylosporangium aurantiacum TaxID=35754 RepID=A0A9Q9IS73_9ACTN|nr:hypothetical protein [Dactylosporangium aurantiacum]MDG6103829.1 hypothetical protein [Dactylosporangium aurantiacum]UWZ58970.1 hypothetical protein Daura_24080 [Dactylosporangium aurantiacum]
MPRLRWRWLATAGVLTGTLTVAWALQPFGRAVNTVTLLLGLGQLVFAAIAWWQAVTAAGGGRTEQERLLDAADTLHRQITQQWGREVGVRRLRHPRPLQLRWKSAADDLPQSLTITPGSLVDDLTGRSPAAGLVDAYRRLPHRQLVILGEPGAGKSTVAMLFVLAAAERGTEPVSAQHPVPVLLTLAAWRADQESLPDWIARRMVEDYPELADAKRYGPDVCARLVAAGLVLPVLDGLDEMPTGLLPDVFDQLNDVAGVGGLQTVVTCRRAEFEAARGQVAPLRLAALAVIRPIRVADSIAFITGEQVDAARWHDVVERMRADPTGPLATALSTPLMTALARAVYERPDTRPAELCDFGDVAAVQRHLLDRILPTVYRPEQLPAADRALSFLAAHLHERLATPNLAWWHLARAVPTAVVVWCVAAVIAAVGAAATAYTQPFGVGTGPDALFGAGIGLAAGTVAGLNAARGMYAPDTPPTGRRRWTALAGAAFRDGLAGALVVCATTGWYFADRATTGGIGLLYLLIQLLVFGTGVGMALSVILQGLALGRGSTPNRAAPRAGLLLPSLASGLGMGMILGLPVGLTLGVVAGVSERDIRSGLITGLLTALVVGSTVGLPVGVGRWFATPVEADTPLTPRTVLRGDLISLLVTALSCAVTAGVGDALLTKVTADLTGGSLVRFGGLYTNDPYEAAPWAGLVAFGAVLLGSGAPSVSYAVAHAWLATWRRLPWRLFEFLEDAHERASLLRQLGAVYQFRHARLMERLADRHRPGAAGRLVETGAEVGAILRGQRPPPRRVARLGATVVATAVLPALLVAVSFPVARDRFQAAIAAERSNAANHLIAQADELQENDRLTALRLRAAAAELDSDQSSLLDLSTVLDILNTGEVLTWRRTSDPAVEGDRWLVLNDDEGRGTAWGPAGGPVGPVSLGTTGSLTDVSERGSWAVSGKKPRTVWRLSDAMLRPVHVDDGADLRAGPGGWLLCRYPDGRLTAFDPRLWPSREVPVATGVDDTTWPDRGRWVYASDEDDANIRVVDFGVDPPAVTALPDPAAQFDSASADLLVTTAAKDTYSVWDPSDLSRPRWTGRADASPDLMSRRLIVAGDRLVDLAGATPRSTQVDEVVAVAPGRADLAVVLDGSAVVTVDFSTDPPTRRTVLADVVASHVEDGTVLLSDTGSRTTYLMETSVFPPRITTLGSHINDGVYDDGGGHWMIDNGPSPPVRVTASDRSINPAIAVGDSVAVLPQSDGTVRVVDLVTGRVTAVGVAGTVTDTDVSDDGRSAFVITANTVTAVDVASGEQHNLGKAPVRYRELYMTRTYANLDGWIAVWKEPTVSGPPPTLRHVGGEAIDAVCRIVQRSLSRQEWSRYAPGQPYTDTCPGR